MDPAWNPLPVRLEALITTRVAKRRERTSVEPGNLDGTQVYPSILTNCAVTSRARDKSTHPGKSHHSMLCSLFVAHCLGSNTHRQWSNKRVRNRSTYPGSIRFALLSAIAARRSPWPRWPRRKTRPKAAFSWVPPFLDEHPVVCDCIDYYIHLRVCQKSAPNSSGNP